MADYDFIRLTFDGKSSDTFGLYVVSGGDMYSESITPEFENRTTRVPGRPLSLYWGTDLLDKTFEIKLATDGMTDLQFNAFKKHFKPGKVGKLSFEETGFQYYYVILATPPVMNFVPFEQTIDGYRQNIYKGDISLSFLTLRPYAQSDLYLGTDYTATSWYVRSGLPLLTDFPASDNVYYFLAENQVVKNRELQDPHPLPNGASFKVYHAGNNDADMNLQFTLNSSIGESPNHNISWLNLVIEDLGILTKPIALIDIERTIDLVGASFSNWEQEKATVLNLLREELSSELRDSLLAMVNATGAGLTFTTVAALITRLTDAFFTGVSHRFSINGFTKQCSLTFINALITPATDNITRGNIVCDATGSYNGNFIPIEANGLKTPSLTIQTINFSAIVDDISVYFKNTYV